MAVIFYLSGTGNSLYAAKYLQTAFRGCRLEKIGNYLKCPYPVEDKIVGIICPVYCFALPPIVVDFIKILQIRPQYCFTIVTMGANAGFALKELQSELYNKNIILDYAKDLIMPDNFFAVPEVVRQKLLQSAEKNLSVIKQELMVKSHTSDAVKGSWLWESFGTALAWKYMDKILKINQLYADDKCIGCGLCSKICPMENISIIDNRPVFGKVCAHCLGCLHWCPVNAVHAGRKYIKMKNKYVHPYININDM